MYAEFLSKARGIIGFEQAYGVLPRMTPMGFPLPSYPPGDAGMTMWEQHYGETCRAAPGSMPFSVVTADASPLPNF